MDVPADQPTQAAVQRVEPRRRRPSGYPPPLPHHLQTTGVGWLTAAVVLVTLSLLVFAGDLQGPAVAVTVAEDRMTRWLAGLQPPGLLPVMRALAALGSWMAVNVLLWGLLLALVIRRRLRHLLVMLLVWIVEGLTIQAVLAPMLQRPRPFGVEFRTAWTAWALPSAQLAALSVTLLGILYTLVPEGRWRRTGKWAATALVALVAVAHVYLAIEAPSDILVGVAVGVATGLLGFRLLAPSAAFPVSYRRGRTAHLDVGGVRGQAIRQALHDQLGLIVDDVQPFGLAGSAGSTPLRIQIKGDPPTRLFGKLSARSHLRADRWYKLGRELLYGRLEDEKPFNTVRRLVQTGGLRAPEALPGGAAHPATLRRGGAHPRAGVPAGQRVLRRRGRAQRGRGRRLGDRRRPLDHQEAVGGRPGPPRHQAGQPAGPRRPPAADRRVLHRGPPHAVAPSGRPGQH
ncbi:MAG TPA: phosphatase PAP2 family protein, partial [Actinomycetota bacterium]|nr:phosphatase PAP2 family protein [Actinomycetota bacterium]